MKKKVEVYLKTYSIPGNIEEYTHASSHTYCAPDMIDGVRGQSGFKGRIVKAECKELLSEVKSNLKKNQDIVLYDVGRSQGLIKAITAGVWKTPAVIINGEKYIGQNAAMTALHSLESEN